MALVLGAGPAAPFKAVRKVNGGTVGLRASCVELRLDEVTDVREVGVCEIGAAEVGIPEVGLREVSVRKISAWEVMTVER